MEQLLAGVLPFSIVCAVTLVAARLLHWVYRWINPGCSIGILPPGSMGLPIIGESFQFFRPSPSLDLPPFYKLRLNRYGRVFKTNLVCRPVVVSMDSEFNHFIFKEEGKLFQSWYPDTSNYIFGRQSTSTNTGSLHRYARGIAKLLFGVENLKGVLLTELCGTVTSSLASWAEQPTVEIKEAISDMVFDLTANKLIGFDVPRARSLRRHLDTFFQGMITFPIYVPGTTFYKCMQGRKNVQKMLKDLLGERLNDPEKRHGDLLDLVVEDLRSENLVASQEFCIDLVAALLFASFATISSTITVAMKFLTEHPEVVNALTEEHENLLRSTEVLNSSVTWSEYKSMKFTS